MKTIDIQLESTDFSGHFWLISGQKVSENFTLFSVVKLRHKLYHIDK